MQFRRVRRGEVSINIAPLVDVVFLLVIFFAVSTTFLDTAGLKLELPTSTSVAQRDQEDVTVVMGSDGRLSVGDTVVARDELAATLRGLLAEHERKVVVLRADSGTTHGQVVEVMDVIRESGALGLTVAAKSPPPG